MALTSLYEEGGAPTIQFKFNTLLFEILREEGKRLGLSPHLKAKQLLLEKMREEKMLPNRNFQTLIEDMLYGLGKKWIEKGVKK